MPDRAPDAKVVQMRLVVEGEDYDAAVTFYRDVLGLTEELAIAGPDGAHVTILSAGGAAGGIRSVRCLEGSISWRANHS